MTVFSLGIRHLEILNSSGENTPYERKSYIYPEV